MESESKSNVVSMGVKAHSAMNVEQAINAAAQRNLDEVLILGYEGDELVVMSSRMTRGDGLLMLRLAEEHIIFGVEDK